MSTRYVCDWCLTEFEDRDHVGHVDLTVDTHAESLHICAECVPDHLKQHFPDPKIVTDGGVAADFADATAPDDAELTRFQLEILYILARESPTHGLGIKADLSEYYGEDIHHGRLYPNLDRLVEAGYVSKSKRDERTNEYVLTGRGGRLLCQDAQRRYGIADHLNGGDA